jgi:hypothetical protein
MSARRPQTARATAALPSLAALLASAAGCERPSCEDTRARELERHADRVSARGSAGDLTGFVREVGLAVGLVRHGQEPSVQPAGAIVPVTQTPPVVLPPPQMEPQVTGGTPMEVLPTPPSPPSPRVQPRPPRVQPRPPQVQPPRPQEPEVVMGRRAAVGPTPRE